MCGIAAVLGAPAGIAGKAVAAMASAMVHRGPDDHGLELLPTTQDTNGPVMAFGFRRLAIQDLSPLGHQPMVNPDTGDVLIFNGEIYNFKSVRASLVAEGVQFRSGGDTEVLLQALSRWGSAALKLMSGMFAIAFFHRATRRVLIARDPLGIKPLYVSSADGVTLVASEVRSVLASGLVNGEADPRGLAGLLAYGAVQEPFTFFKSIRAFPAGSCQLLTPRPEGGVDAGPIERYWSCPEVDHSLTEADVYERLRAEFDTAMREHLISDVPVGVFLSAGIDSTVLAGLSKHHASDLRTFTVGFSDQPDLSEITLAERTARVMGTRHTNIQISNHEAEAQTQEWFGSLDQPSVDGLNTYVISKAVRQAGVIVAISGLGGDELFCGYPSFLDVPRMMSASKRMAWLPESVRGMLYWLAAIRRPASIREKVREISNAGSDPLRLYLLRRRAMTNRRLSRLGISSANLGLDDCFQDPAVTHEARTADFNDPASAISRWEMQFYMGNMLLRDSDTNGMAHSLELRVPMLDTRIVNLACQIPNPIRLPGGSPPKHLLRTAFGHYLRPELTQMGKKGFTLPIRRWMMGPLRPMCESALDRVRSSGMLERREVDQIWSSFTASPESPGWSSAFVLAVLGTYLESAQGFLRKSGRNDRLVPATSIDSAVATTR
jgi:asparagine synthase (glutamine-hydrolysing)